MDDETRSQLDRMRRELEYTNAIHALIRTLDVDGLEAVLESVMSQIRRQVKTTV